jgi:hypothetical protein
MQKRKKENRTKKSFNFKKFFYLLSTLLILSIILISTRFLTKKNIFKNKAAESNLVSGNYQLVRNLTNSTLPDWQTKEIYQYSLIYELDTKNVKNNRYPIKFVLFAYGLPQTIFGQTVNSVDYQGNKEKFTLIQKEPGKYESSWFLTNFQNCVDFFKTQNYLLNDYIASSCYKIYLLSGSRSYRIYSPNGTMFIDFDYKGDEVVVLSANALFDRKESFYSNSSIWNNPYGERSVYFTYDSGVKNVSFSNIKYTISGKMVPTTSELEKFNNYICGIVRDNTYYPQLHRTFNNAFPSGGEFIDYQEKVGYCSFSYTSNYFLYGYLSHSPMVEKIETTKTPTLSSCPPVVCDINGDKKEDINDGNLIKSCWNKPAIGDCAKVNVDCQDNLITTTDIQRFSYQCPHIFSSPSPTKITIGECKKGQTKPYYRKIGLRCIKINDCGVSNCRPNNFLPQ